MKMEVLKDRTKDFAVQVVRLVTTLPQTDPSQVLGRKLLRSGTNVGSAVLHASHSRSEFRFLSRLRRVARALEHTQLNLDLLVESGIVQAEQVAPLQAEAEELANVISNSIDGARRRT